MKLHAALGTAALTGRSLQERPASAQLHRTLASTTTSRTPFFFAKCLPSWPPSPEIRTARAKFTDFLLSVSPVGDGQRKEALTRDVRVSVAGAVAS